MFTLEDADSGSSKNPENEIMNGKDVNPERVDSTVTAVKKGQSRKVRMVMEGHDPVDPVDLLLYQYEDAVEALNYLDGTFSKSKDFPSKEDVALMLKEMDCKQSELLKGFKDPQLIIVPPVSMETLEWDFDHPSAAEKIFSFYNQGVNNRRRENFEVTVVEGGKVDRGFNVTAPRTPSTRSEDVIAARLGVAMRKVCHMLKKGYGCLEADEFSLMILKKVREGIKEDDAWFCGDNPDCILNAEYIGAVDKRISGGSVNDNGVDLYRAEVRASTALGWGGISTMQPKCIVPVLRLQKK